MMVIREVIMTGISRDNAVEALRRAGFADAADEIMRVLPDPVDRDALVRVVEPFGLRSICDLISAMGGSP
jgi:hypothetical protein